jgi:hypothetical protein
LKRGVEGMAEKRMIARAVSQSRKLSKVSLKAALVWTWAIPWFDGYGFIEAEPDFLKYNVLPRRDDISLHDLPGVLRELSGSGLWKIYKDKETGRLIAFDPKFKEFQNLRMEREGKQKFTPGELQDYSGSTPAEDKIDEVKLSEVKIEKQQERPPSLLPTIEEKKELSSLCVQVNSKCGMKFNSFAWIQKNIGLNPQTHIHVLRRLLETKDIRNPWGLADQIASIEDGNYNEKDHISESEKHKIEPGQVGNIFKNIMSKNMAAGPKTREVENE